MALLPSGKTVWGLDIASSAIKGVKMRAAGGRVRILDADILALEGEPVASSDSPGRDRRIWRGLQRFQAKHDVATSRVAVGLPGPIFFTRPFSFPLVGARSEDDLARFELEQHIPFGLDAVLWDYALFEGVGSEAGIREGLLFAMKKEVLNNYLLSLSAARIEPSCVQATQLALYYFVRHEIDPEGTVLVMDVGAATTNLIAMNETRYWMRTLSVGAESVTAAVQGAFQPRKVSRREAEAIKVNLPLLTRRQEVSERISPAYAWSSAACATRPPISRRSTR